MKSAALITAGYFLGLSLSSPSWGFTLICLSAAAACFLLSDRI